MHELQLIETLLAQVGSQCRGDDDVPFIVILHARKNPEAESLFESLTWRKRVKLIHGDGMNESDMRRAGVARAPRAPRATRVTPAWPTRAQASGCRAEASTSPSPKARGAKVSTSPKNSRREGRPDAPHDAMFLHQ